MKKIKVVRSRVEIKRAFSIVLVWLLVASGFLVVFPMSLPTAEAFLLHSNSAAWEDSDMWDGVPGGPDYNGDPANDGKITWHAVNNSHIVVTNFVVEDGYILEIEAGVVIEIDPSDAISVGQATGATFYSNGTFFQPVMVTTTTPGSSWQGIFINTRSYAFMDYTMIDSGGVIQVLSAALDMDNSAIRSCNQPGIYADSSTISVTNSYIADTEMGGIFCSGSDAVIDNNDIYGYNGTDGSPGGIDGGHGVIITGAKSVVTISNNRIYGGNGGDDLTGMGGGAGGIGIFDINYNGQVIITSNEIIKGGKGGNNIGQGMLAGEGGMGIHIMPISDSASSPAVEISGNTAILGGRGGDNDVPPTYGDGEAGGGGNAIMISDDPPGSAGDVVISLNTDIIGGEGGHNHAKTNNTGWTAGNGGVGIVLSNTGIPGYVLIDQNTNIAGGSGGNNTGIGNLGMRAGDGGNGLLLFNSTNVTVTQSYIVGGDGGNNTPTGMMASAGDGGSGVFLYNPTTDFVSMVDITDSTLTGGEGGDDWVGMTGPIQGGAGNGGSALYSYPGMGSCTFSDLFGGKGGNNYGPTGGGGSGGYGAAFINSLTWTVSEGTITGGKGGDNFGIDGGGGSGGYASVISNSNNIDLGSNMDIIGGDGGDANQGIVGPAAQNTISVQSSFNIDIIENIILPGTGGYNSTSGKYGENGSTCISGFSMSGLSSIVGNDITVRAKSGNRYGIFLGASTAVIADNDVYTSEYGIAISNSNGITIGDNNRIYDNEYGIFSQNSNPVTIGNSNEIHNNSIGVYLDGSDASIGSGNTIRDNDYGISSTNSNPTITGDQILNSSQMGLYLQSGSDATVERTSIIESVLYSVYCVGGSSPRFYNSTLDKISGAGDFYIDGNSHPWTLNTTFNKGTTNIVDPFSNLTVNWYLHVRVVDVSNNPVSNADVWVNDTHSNNTFYGQTPGDGWIRWLIVTEYIENQSDGKYYYTPHNVSAVEGIRFGNEITSMALSKEVIIVLGGMKFDIPLFEGWNMISVPLNMTDTTLENVLSDLGSNYRAVQWYNVNDIVDLWKHYHIDKMGMNDLTNIDRSMGIWILMKSDDTLTVAGSVPVPSTTDIQLKTGWNLVGYPSLTSRNAGTGLGEAFESISAYVDMVEYYNASDISDHWKMWDPTPAPDDLVVVEPGFGLWIHVNGDCTWSVDW
ncbi:MAG: right-handed parallel beta-helix repeat-containing protein [Thermoplasmata archaeon]|nr:MAG: right-handed parallel beta-helix repeat-containing protein [Thermoplasmata archaeon]